MKLTIEQYDEMLTHYPTQPIKGRKQMTLTTEQYYEMFTHSRKVVKPNVLIPLSNVSYWAGVIFMLDEEDANMVDCINEAAQVLVYSVAQENKA